MKRFAIAMLVASTSGCVEAEDELETSTVEQGLSSVLLTQAYGFGREATNAATSRNYVVTSTADDGSCGTLRYGVETLGPGTWITFDPQVFPPNTKKAIYLDERLMVPSNVVIDGRGSWVSLRHVYQPSDRPWLKKNNGTYECQGSVQEPILDIRNASNVIVTNLDFLQEFPLGVVQWVSESGLSTGWVDLSAKPYGDVDTQCFADPISIGFNSKDIWIDHSDFTHCGDGCIDVRNYEPTLTSEVTLSNNKFSYSNKAVSIGAYADATATGTLKIAVSMYQNRFISVNRRQPRVEAAVAHIYNNVYEDWLSAGVQVHATNLDDNPVIVNSRAVIEHNVFRAVTRTNNTYLAEELAPDLNTTDARFYAKTNRCTSGATPCTDSSSFPACGSAWYYPCTNAMRGNLISIASMDYYAARDRLRPLGGSSRTVFNDVIGSYPRYVCPAP